MSISLEDGPLKEAAILTRAVENVFRKLIRLLLGRMTLVKLQEMIRLIFVEEAELQLKRERPGKNVSLSNMALFTGLDTRTLNKVLAELQSKVPVFEQSGFLKEITPESNVLDYWSSNGRYLSKLDNRPKILPLRGKAPSFESLVFESCSLRGVTANSMLQKLVSSNSVSVDEENECVSLLQRIYMPISEESYSAQLEVGFGAVGFLLETLLRNIQGKTLPENKFFQRSNWTSRLNLNDRQKFRLELRRLLVDAENDIKKLMSKFEIESKEEGQLMGGVSMFYFEEDLGV